MVTLLTKLVDKMTKRAALSKGCYFCKRKAVNLRHYKNEANKSIVVCALCVEYAERRAYRK